jgi:hypothetical protein
MSRVPSTEELRPAGPGDARAIISDARRDLNWLLKLMSDDAHRQSVEAKLALLDAREREFMDAGAVATEASP